MINVSYRGDDSHNGPRNRLGVNAIDAQIGSHKLELPRTIPNSAEIEYARRSGQTDLNTPFQFVKLMRTVAEIRNLQNRRAITRQYQAMLSRMNGFGDFFLQRSKDTRFTNQDRNFIHEIQRDAGALNISDCESDRYQNASDFENEILATQAQYPELDVSPTIDVRIEDEDLFDEKLQVIITNGFKRFNVIYGSIPDNITNWIDLSYRIFKRRIWCNGVGVSPRWQRSTMISQISRVFLFGVHTISLGYPWFSTPNARPHNFIPARHRFVHVPGANYEQTRAGTIRNMVAENSIGRDHIIGHSYFRRYVPARDGLRDALIAVA